MAASYQSHVANEEKKAQKDSFPFTEYGFEPLETR